MHTMERLEEDIGRIMTKQMAERKKKFDNICSGKSVFVMDKEYDNELWECVEMVFIREYVGYGPVWAMGEYIKVQRGDRIKYIPSHCIIRSEDISEHQKRYWENECQKHRQVCCV